MNENNTIVMIGIEKLDAHPDNPRKEIGDISELVASIKAKGIMQNLTVVPWFTPDTRQEVGDEMSGYYRVIIGHRRLAAAREAGLTEVPCVITHLNPQEQIETMLLENMQRSDLTAYEQAQGFQMMLNFGDSVEEVSEKTGFSETTIRRRIKLCELPPERLKAASDKQITFTELDRLSKIENKETRSRVLAAYGTKNYENEYAKAVNAQNRDKQKKLWRDALAERGLTEIPESEVFAEKYKYVSSYRFDTNDPSCIEAEIEEGVEYFYGFAYENWVYIRRIKVITAEDEKETAERERVNAEKQAKETALKEASKRAFELRKRFIKTRSNSDAKKHIKEIIPYAISRSWMPDCYSSSYDRNLYAELMSVEIPAGDLNYGVIQVETENCPEYALLAHAYTTWNDSEANKYYDWRMMYCQNNNLDAIYTFLEKLGYEMSDEEISLRDGTSDLFEVEE